jgi:inorganic pyrophosphatase
MSISNVRAGDKLPHEFNVIIEIPMNADPIKYEVDADRNFKRPSGSRLPTTCCAYPALC